jgi:hypothetical protein
MSGIGIETVSKSAVVHVEETVGVKVAVARVSFSYCPGASASFTVQLLNKEVAAKHMEEVTREVAAFAAQVMPEAQKNLVPIGWPEGAAANETS